MRIMEQTLDHGVIEVRTYDETNRLVDIRRIQPKTVVRRPFLIRTFPGSMGCDIEV